MEPSKRARPADTSVEAWSLQMQLLRSMSVAERAELANRLSIDCLILSRRDRTA
ncbi:MAG: hypothetical protein AAGA17_04785 [Actinomycetota bacterium]